MKYLTENCHLKSDLSLINAWQKRHQYFLFCETNFKYVLREEHSLLTGMSIVTARNSSCRKVMFLQVSVCLSQGWVSLVPTPFWGLSVLVPGPFGEGVGMSRRVCPGVGISRRSGYPQILTPSGSHRMYHQQAGGTHPTEMPSCFIMFYDGYLWEPFLLCFGQKF